MQVVETPQALPGQCKFCGHSDRKLYLDTGMHEEFYGAWFICDECVTYIASLFGFIDPERARLIQDESARVVTENISLVTEVNALRMALREITSTMEPVEELHAGSVDFSYSDGSFSYSDPAESDDVAAGELSESEQQLDSGEGTFDESSHVEGLADLRSTPSESGNEFTFNI